MTDDRYKLKTLEKGDVGDPLTRSRTPLTYRSTGSSIRVAGLLSAFSSAEVQ
jgi:hypothetical protein